MSETELPQALPTPAPDRPAAPVLIPPAPAQRRRNVWPLLGLIGFLILAAGEGYLYRLHQLIPNNATQIAVLQAQVASLQQYAMRAQPAPDSVTVQADLAQKFADLNAQVAALTAQSASDHTTLASLAATNTDLTKITAKMTQLSRLESARMALDAGQPLGDIQNAPPVLAKFATAPPPTQADLLLGFPAAARAANIASVEKIAGKSYWSRVQARLEGLITITNGSHVLIGPPAAAITDQAGLRLNAGDLGGAVAALGNLSPTTQAAMGNWLVQARDLLAARAALIARRGSKLMLRAIAFLIVAAILLVLAWGIGNIPGTLTAHSGAYTIETSAPAAIILLAVIVVILTLMLRLFGRLRRAPGGFGNWRSGRRLRQGEAATERGIVALAAGNAAAAQNEALAARKLLGETPLVLLLTAESARLAGKPEQANAAFQQLTRHKGLAYLGHRGLLAHHLAAGDHDAATTHALAAEDAFPGGAWTKNQRLEIALRKRDYPAALGLARNAAEIAALASAAANEAGSPADALHYARQAVKAAPVLPRPSPPMPMRCAGPNATGRPARRWAKAGPPRRTR